MQPKKMKMEKTRKAECEPERKIRRKITSLDDDELWARFEWEETERIQSGEIKPKTLITTSRPSPPHPERLAQAMISMFPDSKYVRRGVNTNFRKVTAFAKENGFTSIILVFRNHLEQDGIVIISLLNCATAIFRVHDLIPLEDIPNHAIPKRRHYPQLEMRGFNSPASARLIQSLFPKVLSSTTNVPSSSTTKVPCGRGFAWVEKQNNYIFFRRKGLFFKEGVAGESSSVSGRRGQMQWQECGPRFALELTCVKKLSIDKGHFYVIYDGFNWDPL